jgi:SAM-dependent methyltransferase
MRSIPFGGGFEGALSLFTSFGYFDDGENARCLEQVRDCLAPGGAFVLDTLNRERALGGLGTTERSCPGNAVVRETRGLDPSGCRIEKRIELRRGADVHRYFESVALYSAGELSAMLENAGFSEIRLSGDLDGRPYDRSAPRLVLFARRSAP